MRTRLLIAKKELYENVIIFFFIMDELIGMITGSDFKFYIDYLLLGIIVVTFLKKWNKKDLFMVVYLFITVLASFLSRLHTENYNLNGWLYKIALFSVALFMCRSKLNVLFAKALFWIITAYFLIQIIFGNGNHAFYSTSRNYISVVYIFINCLLVLSCEDNAEGYKLIYSVVPVIFSIIAMGRGGIIASFLFYIFSLYFLTVKVNAGKKKRKYLFAFAISIFVFLLWGQDLIKVMFSRFFSEGMQDESRNIIWTEYISLLVNNKDNIIWGATVSQNSYLNMFGGNLHNSYLMIHSHYGIFYFILQIILIICSMIQYIKHKKYMIVSIYIAFLVRAFTDVLFSTYWGDIFLWYFIMYPFTSKFLLNEYRFCSR